jgi:fructokinase
VITVVGEALIDLVGAEGSRFDAHPGGSPLNVAVGLARLGQPTTMMARLADDAFGRILRQHATDNGVDLSAAPVAAEPTTLAVVSLDAVGRASYDFYVQGTADWQWTDAELAAVPATTEILHTGSLAAWTDPGQEHIFALVSRLRERMLISYDPNIRPRLLQSPERARPMVERSVAAAHVVKTSDEDLAWLYGDEPLEAVARRWLATGPELVIVTRGGDGVFAVTRAGCVVQRPSVPIELVDTVGAGDAFSSGLLAGLRERALTRPDAVAAVDAAALAAILDQAGLAAALTCEQAGAKPPSRAELEAARDRLPA